MEGHGFSNQIAIKMHKFMKRRNRFKILKQGTFSLGWLSLFGFFFLCSGPIVAQEQSGEMQGMKVKISFGQKGPPQTQKQVFLKSSIPGFKISDLVGEGLESDDQVD